MSQEDYRMQVSTGDGLCTEITVDGHELVADEPSHLGGTEAGPTPYDYLMGALGSCTAMTIRMYADRREWPLESVKVRLKHQKIYAEDCSACETENGKIDHIEREIELTGGLDDEQREKLLQIADKCPVHRTLESETVVETTSSKGDS